MPVSYVSRPLQGMEICYTPTEKRVQALIHTARSLRAVFRKHKEAEGPVVKKFFGQEEQVEEKPDANEGGVFDLSKGLQENVTPATSACRLYLGRETIEEGSYVGIILVSPKEKMYSYAIRLKIKAQPCHGRRKPYTDNRTRKKVQRGNYGCNGPIPQVPNHTSPKNLKPKSKSGGLATIKLEFLNQEVSVGIKTRPSIEETSSSKKGKATSKAPGAKPNCNHEASGSN
ncbi:hypothetical protein Tco_0606333 [Tanacetum coccineum]